MNSVRRRRWPRVLGLIAVVLAAAYWWFFVQVPGPRTEWALDVAEVRRLAGSMAGDKPTEVRVERVGTFQFPHAIIESGGGWGMRPMALFSYQLVFPTHRAIIDTAQVEPLPGGANDAAAVTRLQAAMGAADLIVVTHEHGDHLGGLATHPQVAALMKAAKLTKEQLAHPELMRPAAFPPAALSGYQPVDYDKYLAVAPGVVLIRAAGHTPGSQLVYVQRADGAEYLFLGDTAWTQLNVEQVAERPRAITLLIGEDRGVVVRQLAELAALAKSEPQLHQVPGHDPGPVDQLVAQHLLEEKFAQ
ncbi:MAG: MBL fold metallo-hydrolase [Archangiaceae bacterium]|nr:MBL fold metallo-hydrolase [Archangiaceae bacterium]